MTAPVSMDWSRARELVQGMPSNYISEGYVGHLDTTAYYARIENNQALVEVTLVPSGEEVIATVLIGNGQFYGGLQYGQQVLVAMPNGNGSQCYVLGPVSNQSWEVPSTVAEVPITSGPAPIWCFFKSADGQLIGIESGEGADILIHSGGSIRLAAPAGEQILLRGRTHLGADFTTSGTGQLSGPNGEITPGIDSSSYVPPTNVPTPGAGIPLPPFLGPADGLVRAKDTVQSDITVDPSFWAWVLAVSAAPQVAAAMVVAGIPDPPVALDSQHKTASLHTATDA